MRRQVQVAKFATNITSFLITKFQCGGLKKS
jgi:hypothetical protein